VWCWEQDHPQNLLGQIQRKNTLLSKKQDPEYKVFLEIDAFSGDRELFENGTLKLGVSKYVCGEGLKRIGPETFVCLLLVYSHIQTNHSSFLVIEVV
jgi:hypothetical protein